MNDILGRLKCFFKGHEWKHERILSEYEDNRGDPPNIKTIYHKCLNCNARKVKIIYK
jgi:hypothetical protein